MSTFMSKTSISKKKKKNFMKGLTWMRRLIWI